MLFTLETAGIVFAVIILRYTPTTQSGYMEVGGIDKLGCFKEGLSPPQINQRQSFEDVKSLRGPKQESHADTIDAGRERSMRPSLINKASTSLPQWIRKHQTRSVILCLCLHVTFEFLFVGLLTFNLEDLLGASDHLLVLGIVISGSLSFIACTPLWLLPQYKEELLFKVPLMPLAPLTGLLSCVILLLHFDFLAFIQVLVWTCIGLLVYFTYGIKHSVEGVRQDGYENL
ncbi:cationic amino acid transporter 2-like [Acanthaster planci]|uniref:Cationic amino acid transporter 2-like n=1 Tax=Acanthaster planci TaxID=133434 RepID=A0A8B7XVL5_ACAPL|nr:cationic amino acid transporter 2-like [Acanthaster planci]